MSATGAEVIADAVAAAVRACPAVAGLHGGRYGEVATYLPGRAVLGVRVTDEEVSVHVVGRYPASITEIAGQVRTAVRAVVADRLVSVTVEDLAVTESRHP
ncbi:hypothetical protein QRX60_29175 [Amycolatopsis mongoliensis]|uniref:Asp23/Gls24 family envelope stress response protein n=1 Tax=Amycolatopsis mongoliensis TaxID=715475 RepID=A0A9Y2JGP4_9PSEU|nr:hypothetical protein [Amycolatopsis sp. 4-36]WIX98137.1 hypothetical protein QRX60_29175 [Amycolatopsis sp. 4-36]